MSPLCLKIFKSFPWHLGKTAKVFMQHLPSDYYLDSLLHIFPFITVSASLTFILFIFFILQAFLLHQEPAPPDLRITGPSAFSVLALVWPAQKQHVLHFPLFITTSVILNQILRTLKKLLFHDKRNNFSEYVMIIQILHALKNIAQKWNKNFI